MFNECAGTGCGFCRWRQAHPIELGWEKLLECPNETDTDSDFVADLDFDDFSVDATVEGLLAEAKAKADVQPPSKNIRQRRPGLAWETEGSGNGGVVFFSQPWPQLVVPQRSHQRWSSPTPVQSGEPVSTGKTHSQCQRTRATSTAPFSKIVSP